MIVVLVVEVVVVVVVDCVATTSTSNEAREVHCSPFLLLLTLVVPDVRLILVVITPDPALVLVVPPSPACSLSSFVGGEHDEDEGITGPRNPDHSGSPPLRFLLSPSSDEDKPLCSSSFHTVVEPRLFELVLLCLPACTCACVNTWLTCSFPGPELEFARLV